MTMHQSGGNGVVLAAALLGASSVGLGAFGAHGLHDLLTERGTMDWWEKGVFYALVHVPVLLWTSGNPQLRRLPWLLLAGVIIFSGLLWAMALGAPRWLGAVVPVGGVMILCFWLGVAWTVLRHFTTRSQGSTS